MKQIDLILQHWKKKDPTSTGLRVGFVDALHPPWFSLRCFFIAQSYVLVKKWSEALVLYERVLKYAKEVQSKAKSLNNSLKVGHCANTRT